MLRVVLVVPGVQNLLSIGSRTVNIQFRFRKRVQEGELSTGEVRANGTIGRKFGARWCQRSLFAPRSAEPVRWPWFAVYWNEQNDFRSFGCIAVRVQLTATVCGEL